LLLFISIEHLLMNRILMLSGPNGGDVSTRITETTAGSFRVEYTPMTAGKWND